MVLKEFFEKDYNVVGKPFKFIQDYHSKIPPNGSVRWRPSEHTYPGCIAELFSLESRLSTDSGPHYPFSEVRSYAKDCAAAQDTACACVCSAGLEPGQVTSGRNMESPWGGFLLPHNRRLSPENMPMPPYLWNIARGCTVKVKELGFVPTSTCISHTWGRWTSGSTVQVDGVEWPVPGNTRFKVEELAQILRSAAVPTDFVWMDLLCIPQSSHDLPLQSQEIAKQAAIFAGASACVAWLNDVSSWEGLMPTVRCLSSFVLWHNVGFRFASHPSLGQTIRRAIADADPFRKLTYHQPKRYKLGGHQQIPQRYQCEFHSAPCCSRPVSRCMDCLQFLHSGSHDDESSLHAIANVSPDWFSSLWTLQEASLSCYESRKCEIRLSFRQHGSPYHFEGFQSLNRPRLF